MQNMCRMFKLGVEGPAMLILTIQVDAPAGQAQGIKEQLAAILERWGDTRVVKVEERGGEQLRLGV